MIYLESNIHAHIGYNISDTKDYLSKGRELLISKYGFRYQINQLISLLGAIDTCELKVNTKASLFPIEVIHLQNMYFESLNNPENILQLDAADIYKESCVMDGFYGEDIRLILLNDLNFYNQEQFSILKHNEDYFNVDKTYITIFITNKFINEEDDDKFTDNVINLIFTFVDWLICNGSKVTYNVFSEHPISCKEEFSDFTKYSPRIIFRNRLSTMEIMFMTEYFISLCWYLEHYFHISKDQVIEKLKKYPIFDIFADTDIIERIYTEIRYSKNDPNNEYKLASIIQSCEFDVSAIIRDAIMNMPYEEEE